MPEEVGGKIFYSPEEAAAAGFELSTEAEKAAALAELAAHEQRLRQVAPEDRLPPPPERFHDDLSGTEYEEWARLQRVERARHREAGH
ncbi:hypothetical protein [Nocardia brasiliensis]|uniref:hypothetical protein n=1 Tax=Nocardia brasiliensis TaxID=37326 RepID=UPI0011DD0892|nr:hypothetical protein [Nocardia brasiliensis]